jgi:predicted SAM-dependent methyltransferase
MTESSGPLRVPALVRKALPDRLKRRIKRAATGAAFRRYQRQTPIPLLHLGCGGSELPGWFNTDLVAGMSGTLRYLDVTEPFPIPDEAVAFLFGEHLIEHLPFAEGLQMLRECRRVLRRGGVIRITTPSLSRILSLYNRSGSDLEERYKRWAIERFVPEADSDLDSFVINNFFHNWGHRFIYDEATLRLALTRAGFTEIVSVPIGESVHPELRDLERHGSEMGHEFNLFESFALEARKGRAPAAPSVAGRDD